MNYYKFIYKLLIFYVIIHININYKIIYIIYMNWILIGFESSKDQTWFTFNSNLIFMFKLCPTQLKIRLMGFLFSSRRSSSSLFDLIYSLKVHKGKRLDSVLTKNFKSIDRIRQIMLKQKWQATFFNRDSVYTISVYKIYSYFISRGK